MIHGDATLAYLAGIVDGEGSICIYRHKSRTSRAGQMKVVISNTKRELLEFVQSYFGGSISMTNSHLKNPRKQPCYQWIVASQKALHFLEAIEPFLRIKKLQAQIAIQYQYQRRNKGGHSLSEAECAVAEAQRIVMCELNKKGGK